jgi:predicted RNA-binding protein YlxR (DUF448 family)
VGCGRVAPKAELRRVAAVPAAPGTGVPPRVVADPAARLPGRGAYVCDARCAAEAVRRRSLQRAFRGAVTTPPEFVDSIGG